jgi:hypothetical protein
MDVLYISQEFNLFYFQTAHTAHTSHTAHTAHTTHSWETVFNLHYILHGSLIN